MSAAIRSEGLSKSYFIQARGPDGRTTRLEKAALCDLNLEVPEGEVLGIIGRNGAGKSTLLRILSRITAPTRGRAWVYGTVASLLEVGTGMHPEMTGRENVFLNGALLGMPRGETLKWFDRIVEFAGVGDYIDTPIKRYSSGMKVRLAFAVAAHLSADVMIVDEVLAVGDASFRAKCLGAMRDGGSHGRTTLFVSHNMAAVENLCSRVLWLEAGRVREIGPTAEVVPRYLSDIVPLAEASRSFAEPEHAAIGPAVRFTRASVCGSNGSAVAQGDDINVHLEIAVRERVVGLQVLVRLTTIEGHPVSATSNGDYRGEWDLEPGRYAIAMRLTAARLLPRTHCLSLRSCLNWGAETFEDLPEVLRFEVLGRDVLGTGVQPLADRGVTWMPARFELSKLEDGSQPMTTRAGGFTAGAARP